MKSNTLNKIYKKINEMTPPNDEIQNYIIFLLDLFIYF